MGDHVARHGPDARTSDILTPEVNARNEHPETSPEARIRQSIEDLAIQHPLLAGALDVHHRRFSSDGDRFLDPTDA